MSSDVQSTLELLQFTNYTSVIIVSAVGYDYILTFSREVDYIWHREWTWGTTMFIIVRYAGMVAIIWFFLRAGSFESAAITVTVLWSIPVYLAAADLMMILRVYAMWNRSRKTLGALLFIYVVQIITSFVIEGIYNNPNTYISASVIQIQDIAFCYTSWHVPQSLYTYAAMTPRFVLGITLFTLALIRGLKESVDMYGATKQWQPNRYMKLLVEHGILYFSTNVFYNIIYIFPNGIVANGTSLLVLNVVTCITICPMMPRFIIGVRELYHRDSRARGQGIDSGFGILSQNLNSENESLSAIAFAEVTQGQDGIVEGNEESVAIRLDVVGNGAREA